MTPDQLASARATHWREDAQPILTLDDAKSWLEQMQLCLYLPRKVHVLAPAPSFVGAVLGTSNATPPPEVIEQAQGLLVRLVAEGFVVPLNLFGQPGEQPDFLIVTKALPHLAALQADRNWKKPPARSGAGKVSPLAIEIWKAMEREGALTATEIRGHLGHELTEAATIRGLSELWQNLRVAPLPQAAGEPAHWEILSVTHKKEMAAGGTMSQSMALSLLVAHYVQSVLTATAEDVEAFLSPVASRSRLRDVIRGLSATRQLRTLSMDAQTFLFIEGTLPDMPEVPATLEQAAEKPGFMGRSAYRERMLNKVKDDGKTEADKKEDTSPSTYRERRGEGDTDRPRYAASSGRAADRTGDRGRPGQSRTGPPRREGSAGRPARFAGGGSPGGSSRPGRPSFGDRARSGGDRPSFKRTGAEGTSDRPRSPRPFTPREGARPPFRGKPAEGARTFRPRAEGDRPRTTGRPFTPKEGGRPSFRPRMDGDRPNRPPFAGRPSFSDRPRTEKAGADRPRSDRPAREVRSFPPREGSSRPPFRGKTAEGSTRPFRPRSGGDRSSRSFSDRPRPSRPSDDRPGNGRTGNDRPRSNARPFTPRDGSSRPLYRSKPAEGGGRPPRSAGSFTRRDGPAAGRRPSSGSGGRPAARPGSRPASRTGSRPGVPGRNPGGTGRPSGPRPGGPRAGGVSRPSAGRSSGPRSGGPRPGGPRPGGLRPPTRKPRPEKDSE